MSVTQGITNPLDEHTSLILERLRPPISSGLIPIRYGGEEVRTLVETFQAQL